MVVSLPCRVQLRLNLLIMSKKQLTKGNDKASSPTKNKPPVCQHSLEEAQAAKEAAERQKIHQYLKGLEVTSFTEQLAKGITRTSADRVAQGLRNGALEIAPNPSPFPEKVTPPPRLTNEEARQLQNKAKRDTIVKKIEYFYEQIRGENGKQGQGGKEEKAGTLQVQFKEILTKEQHERRMREIVQQKQQRKRRMEQLQAEQSRRRQEEEQKQQAMKKLQEEKQKEMKRQKIQQNLKRRKEQHEKELQANVKLQQELATAKSKSKLYEEMEQRYKSQILLPSLQEKKSKLKQIRDFHKRYDVESIKDHQRQYIQRSLQKSREKRVNSPQWKYQPPSHTERLSKLLKEEENSIKQQLESRRKKLEEMQRRQQLFRQEMREKHQPVVDDEKRREIEERIIKEKNRYDKMHPDIDKKKLGEAYMEIAKRMKRPQSVKQPEDEQSKLLKKEESKSLLRGNHTQQFYEQLRRRKIQNIIRSDQKGVSEKYQMLKMEAQKLGEKLRQKEELARLQGDPQAKDQAAELLLSSIKAKMGIVDLLKNNTRTHSEEAA